MHCIADPQQGGYGPPQGPPQGQVSTNRRDYFRSRQILTFVFDSITVVRLSSNVRCNETIDRPHSAC